MANTGNIIVTERDINPNSATYNQTRTRTYEDTARCPTSTEPNWVEISYICEQQGGFDTGNIILTEEDMNPNSSTYGQTRTRTVSGDSRCTADTNPNWVEQSRVCHIDNNGDNTGFADVTQIDTNPQSSTYNTSRTTSELDLKNCHTLALGTKEYMGPVSGVGTPRTLDCNGNPTLTKNERLITTAYNFFLIVGDCVTTIEDACYRRPSDGSISLFYVVFPDTITSIGYEAFYNIHCLRAVYIYATTPPTIGDRALMKKDAQGIYDIPNCMIYVPAESVEAYKSAWRVYSSVIYPIPV